MGEAIKPCDYCGSRVKCESLTRTDFIGEEIAYSLRCTNKDCFYAAVTRFWMPKEKGDTSRQELINWHNSSTPPTGGEG